MWDSHTKCIMLGRSVHITEQEINPKVQGSFNAITAKNF